MEGYQIRSVTITNSEKDLYPETGKAIAERWNTYNSQLKALWKLEEEGKVLIIAPDSTEGIDTMKHSNEGIMKLYEQGYEKASMIASFLEWK